MGFAAEAVEYARYKVNFVDSLCAVLVKVSRGLAEPGHESLRVCWQPPGMWTACSWTIVTFALQQTLD